MLGTRVLTGIFLFSTLAFVGQPLVATPALAQIQQAEPSPPAPEVAQRLKKLESELRCLVCQNQTLAESPAGLAGDLRREVRALVEAGKSDDAIKQFLRERYGDFVLYRPPVTTKTYVLWGGPFVLLLLGALPFWVLTRRRSAEQNKAAAADVAHTQTTARARDLLRRDD